jgi:hypothetical protein
VFVGTVVGINFRDRGPSPPFRGEREGPKPEGWEGEVGNGATPHSGPPHPALSPRPAGREGKTLADGLGLPRE